MKILFSIILFCGFASALFAQKYSSKKSLISFYSHAPLEDISADNTKASALFNSSTNDIAFSVPIKDFKFPKSLMQQHFNEKYMESDQYPKGTFQGKISGFDTNTASMQDARATGKLTIHGVTREVEIPGTIQKEGNNLLMKSKFIIKLEDYKITIPQLLWQNIAEQVEVTVEFTFSSQ
jgi:polyisoprenoid-binding protein YceI